MEGGRAAALEAMAECIERLEKLVPRTRLDAPLTLNAITPHMQTFKTTFGREVCAVQRGLSVGPFGIWLTNWVSAVVRSASCRTSLVYGEFRSTRWKG